jgi:hypothetical protein
MASFKQVLKDQGTIKTPKKSKSNVLLIDNPPANVRKAIDDYCKAVKEKKAAEAEMKVQGDMITTFASKKQDEKAFDGDFHKSFDLQGEKETIKYVTSDRFIINSEDEKPLKEVFGKKFNEMIREKFEVTMKEEVIENEDLQKEFMALMGDNFSRFFDVKTSLVTTKDFDEKIYSVVENQEKLDEVRTYVRPWKASLK